MTGAQSTREWFQRTRRLTCDDLAWLYADGAITLYTLETQVEALLREEADKQRHEHEHER